MNTNMNTEAWLAQLDEMSNASFAELREHYEVGKKMIDDEVDTDLAIQAEFVHLQGFVSGAERVAEDFKDLRSVIKAERERRSGKKVWFKDDDFEL